MSEAYHSLSLPEENLRALLGALESNLDCAMLESAAYADFVSVARPPDNFHFDASFDLNDWPRGRAFGQSLEMRWRSRGNSFAVLVISDAPIDEEVARAMGEYFNKTPLKKIEDDGPMQAQLWGEWQDPKEETKMPDDGRHRWYEERVPRFFDYPFDEQEQYLSIEVARYRAAHERGDSQTAKDNLAEVTARNEESFAGDFLYRFVRLKPMLSNEREKRER